ncbi:myelin-oligodendrocyte glycoprotein-like [Cyprinodon tularosa]|uniref:myelin-oligodendrocyte glycoprotein-like n=1 Tax=Cyprinodon tularosa TaxID=77115 RepID=UPI0018E2241B|nr:myelin-oligodendrocyte glycoprotein-like [Cyprinodon tularosa]
MCTSVLWVSVLCLSLCRTAVKGNYQLIAPSEPIIVGPGDDVILPCRVDPHWNAVEKTVEWSRPDLKASGPQKRVEYVYVHRFRKMDRDMMMETYIQRTSLSGRTETWRRVSEDPQRELGGYREVQMFHPKPEHRSRGSAGC